MTAPGRPPGVVDEQGTSTIEFALGATLLFMVVCGVIVMAHALYTYNVVAEAAREATRYAIVRGSACNSFADCKVTSAQLQTYVQGLGFPAINSAHLTATTTWTVYPAGGTCAPSASCNNPGNQVKVTVSYPFMSVIPFVPQKTLHMSSTATMVISQ